LAPKGRSASRRAALFQLCEQALRMPGGLPRAMRQSDVSSEQSPVATEHSAGQYRSACPSTPRTRLVVAGSLTGCDRLDEFVEPSPLPTVALDSLTVLELGLGLSPDPDGSPLGVIVALTDGSGRSLFESGALVDLTPDRLPLAFDLGGTVATANDLLRFVFVLRRDPTSGAMSIVAQSKGASGAQLQISGEPLTLGAVRGEIVVRLSTRRADEQGP